MDNELASVIGEILLEGVPLARGSTAYLPNYLLAIFPSLILGIHPRQKKNECPKYGKRDI